MLPAFFRQHSRLVLGFLVLTFPILLVTSESLTSNNDIETWLPEKAPVRQIYDGFKDRFGAEELVLVGLPGEDTEAVVDEELVEAVCKRIESLPGIRVCWSPYRLMSIMADLGVERDEARKRLEGLSATRGPDGLIGIAALLFVFCLVTGILLAVILGLKETALAKEVEFTETLVHQGEIFIFLGLQWLKFVVLTSLTLCVACLSQSSLYTMVVSFLGILACQLQYLAAEIHADAQTTLGKGFGWLLKTLVPNLQIYSLGDRMVLTSAIEPLPPGTYSMICVFSLLYTSVFFGLAYLFFRNREI